MIWPIAAAIDRLTLKRIKLQLSYPSNVQEIMADQEKHEAGPAQYSNQCRRSHGGTNRPAFYLPAKPVDNNASY